MSIINEVPVKLPWKFLVSPQSGNLEDQVEAKDVQRQLQIANWLGEQLFKWEVRDGDQYGNSTWFRVLARVWWDNPKGSRRAFVTRLGIPSSTNFPGSTTIFDWHGPGGYLAPFRVFIKSDRRLYCSYNGGQFNGSGFNGWTPDIALSYPNGAPARIDPDELFAFAVEMLVSDEDGKASTKVMLNGEIIHQSTKANAQNKSGFQKPFLLWGLYTGSVSQPIVMYSDEVVYGDNLAEALARFGALNEQEPPVEPDPDPNPPPPLPDPHEVSQDAMIAALVGRVDALTLANANLQKQLDELSVDGEAFDLNLTNLAKAIHSLMEDQIGRDESATAVREKLDYLWLALVKTNERYPKNTAFKWLKLRLDLFNKR